VFGVCTLLASLPLTGQMYKSFLNPNKKPKKNTGVAPVFYAATTRRLYKGIFIFLVCNSRAFYLGV
jgi:hypothetical protein